MQSCLAKVLRRAGGPFAVRRYKEWAQETGLRCKRDDQWLSVVGANGWFVITKDFGMSNKGKNPMAYEAIRQHGVGCFEFGAANATTWELLLMFCRAHRRIMEIVASVDRPFVYRLFPSGRVRRRL